VLIIQLAINGIAVGCVYALVALGLVLIYKATEAVNFAQGDLLMLGSFFALTFISFAGLPFWLGLALAIAGMALVGVLVDRAVLRPILGQPQFAAIMVTIGVGFVLRSGATMIPGWGTSSQALPTPFTNQTLNVAGVVVAQEHAAIVGATVLLCVALYVFFRHTRFGIAMQAASQNQLAAAYMGIPIKRVSAATWAIAAAVAALGGVLLAPIALVEANMGFIVLKALPAAVLGGFASLPGAVIGGVVIGLIEVFSGRYISDTARNLAPYVVLLLVLVVRPEGLFAEPKKRRA
jgi:branched-chain amino acid transport system permease protein